MASDFNFVETDSAKLYTTIIGNLMDACDEALYPGDERRIFGEGLVAVLVSVYSLFDDRAKQRTLRYARGNVLDAIGERLEVVRLAPSSAAAVFRFTVSAPITENIIIPAGTKITSDGTVYFATEETVVLSAGSQYVDVTAVCTAGGAAYNGFTVGTIATLVDLIPYISGVSNITVTSGGDDGEPYTTEGDDRLRERIRLAPSVMSTAGTESGYRFFVLSADPEIVDVAIDCPEDEPNTVNLYPLMKGGALPDEGTLQKILESVSAENRRPMTDLVQAFTPNVVEYGIEMKYYCSKDDEAKIIQAIEGDGGAIDQYNAWQTTALGRDIDPDQLRSFVFAAKAESGAVGTVRMDVVAPVFKSLDKWQVAQFNGSISITHEVVIG